MVDEIQLNKAAEALRKSRYAIAFTGAGVSVESGIPPFRGESGIWNKYDPMTLELGFFHEHPLESWKVIRELFYSFFSDAKANKAHIALAKFEERGLLKSVITQNIDNLHQKAGSRTVFEFHGNSQRLFCTKCHTEYAPAYIDFDHLPPTCGACSGLIKPDFIFFGENIPMDAYQNSVEAAEKADVVIVIGSTGEVMPAAQMPYLAKDNGAVVIEVNTAISKFTHSITDIYLEGKATEVMESLYFALYGEDLL
jgi:NAD-dependent deacetylase